MGKKKPIKGLLCVCVSLALLFSLDAVVNGSVFPLFYTYAPYAKDISTLAGAITLLAITFLAMHKPFPFITFQICLGFAAAAALGLALIVMGAAAKSAPVTITGALLFSVGSRTVVPMYACFALVACTSESAYLALLFALVLQYPLGWIVSALPLGFSFVYAAIVPFAALPLARGGGVGKVLAGHGKQPLTDLSIANPRSFLPFSSIVFITFALFNMATGCELTYLAEEGVPQSTTASLLLLFVLLILALQGHMLGGDTLAKLSCLFILGGFLIVPLASMPDVAAHVLLPMTPWLFSAGSELLTIVFYLVLAEVGRRNRFGAAPLFAFGYSVMRFGFVTGALLGIFMNENEGAAVIVSVVMVFAFAAYGILLLGKVSFRDLVSNVRIISEVGAHDANDRPVECDLSERIDAAVRDYGLTKRESEILGLLAQGRSIAVIQEKLIVSKNTVKTHVKNIYAKLDVHSQQELIDLVRRY